MKHSHTHYIYELNKKTGYNLLACQQISHYYLDDVEFNAEYSMQVVNWNLLVDSLCRNSGKVLVYFYTEEKSLVRGKVYLKTGRVEDIGYNTNAWYTDMIKQICIDKNLIV